MRRTGEERTVATCRGCVGDRWKVGHRGPGVCGRHGLLSGKGRTTGAATLSVSCVAEEVDKDVVSVAPGRSRLLWSWVSATLGQALMGRRLISLICTEG